MHHPILSNFYIIIILNILTHILNIHYPNPNLILNEINKKSTPTQKLLQPRTIHAFPLIEHIISKTRIPENPTEKVPERTGRHHNLASIESECTKAYSSDTPHDFCSQNK